MRGAPQIFYEESEIDGFLLYVNDPIAKGKGAVYFEYIATSVFPALVGWSSSFNEFYLR